MPHDLSMDDFLNDNILWGIQKSSDTPLPESIFKMDVVATILEIANLSPPVAKFLEELRSQPFLAKFISGQVPRMPRTRQSLPVHWNFSLIDFAVLCGSLPLVAKLASFGVRPLGVYTLDHFGFAHIGAYNLMSQGSGPCLMGLCSRQISAAIAAGLNLGSLTARLYPHRPFDMRFDLADIALDKERLGVWDIAVLSHQTSLAVSLSSAGYTSVCGPFLGCCMLRVGQKYTFELHRQDVESFVTAGGDITSLMVDPRIAIWVALQKASAQCPAMREWLQSSTHPKLCHAQTLLALAIYCGQAELAEYLVRIGAEHTSLTSGDLAANVAAGLYSWSDDAQNEDERTLWAARAAFDACPKHRQKNCFGAVGGLVAPGRQLIDSAAQNSG